MTDIYPDIDDIYDRVAAIQDVIEPLSTQPMTPAMSVDTFPYWLTIDRGITKVADATIRGKQRWTFNFEMYLVRGKSQTVNSNDRIVRQISKDGVTTLKEFGKRLNLQSVAFPGTPAFFVQNSASVEALGFVNTGDLLEFAGSLYTLAFDYDILVSEDEMVKP